MFVLINSDAFLVFYFFCYIFIEDCKAPIIVPQQRKY